MTQLLPAEAIAHFLKDLCVEFPGLEDGETDVNGGDLTDYMASTVKTYKTGGWWPRA